VIGLAGSTSVLIGLVKHYESHGKPATANSNSGKAFVLNARRIVDSCVYQSIQGYWSGAGDSKGRDLILQIEDLGASKSFPPIKNDDWERLVKSMLCGHEGELKKGSIHQSSLPDGRKVSKIRPVGDKRAPVPMQVKKFLWHYYAMTGVDSFFNDPNYDQHSLNWDHLIPDSSFSNATEKERTHTSNLANIAALPKGTNLDKSNHPLSSDICKTGSTANAIKKYSQIDPRVDGEKYNKPSQIEDLIIARGELIISKLSSSRKRELSIGG